jgi:hypothetical protein
MGAKDDRWPTPTQCKESGIKLTAFIDDARVMV